MRNAALRSANVDKKIYEEFKPVLSVSIRSIAAFCVIFSGIFKP
jgi:hypothetical protein